VRDLQRSGMRTMLQLGWLMTQQHHVAAWETGT
jgi:hypothetical protein